MYLSISEDYVRNFCKNARFLQAIQYRSIALEFTGSGEGPGTEESVGSRLSLQTMLDPESPFNWYPLLRATDNFRVVVILYCFILYF